jgi:cobalt-precorrin-5B (C1)-methyltransferase
MSKELRRGYTTGVHTLQAFRLALECLYATAKHSSAYSIKMDNDDLDVTKGCEIVVDLSYDLNDLRLNSIKHKPYIIENLHIYAGSGVGVVTKDGLKPPKGYGAINPTPLKAISKFYKSHKIDKSKKLYATISVTNGEELAKQTANAKVGVVGGISILGTTGFVKPVSSSAYIDSIYTEIEFAKAQQVSQIALTLGNSSYNLAKERFTNEAIVEIGNFVYDAIKASKENGLDVVLYIGVAKAIKIAQGFKNTHNRFGSIDFALLSKWLDCDVNSANTVKNVCDIVGKQKVINLAQTKAKAQINEWFGIDIEMIII